MYGDGDPNVPLFEDFAGEDSSEDLELDDKLARASVYLTAKAAGKAGVAVAVPVRVPVPYKRGPPKQTGLYAGPEGFLGPQRDPSTSTLQRVMYGAQRKAPTESGTSPFATTKGKKITGTRRPPPKKTVPREDIMPRATSTSTYPAVNIGKVKITGNNLIALGGDADNTGTGFDRSFYPAHPLPKKVPKKIKSSFASAADAAKRRATLSFTKTVLSRMDEPTLARVLRDMQQNPPKNSTGKFNVEILQEASSPTSIPSRTPFTHTHTPHLRSSPLTHRPKVPSSRCRRISSLIRRPSKCWNVWTTGWCRSGSRST